MARLGFRFHLIRLEMLLENLPAFEGSGQEDILHQA
jgi:hypothetical protein